MLKSSCFDRAQLCAVLIQHKEVGLCELDLHGIPITTATRGLGWSP
jgi:hypothetical protein